MYAASQACCKLKIVQKKNQKRGWSMVQGQVFIIGRVGIFPIWFFQGLSFLHLEISWLLANFCYAFDEKLFFPVTIIAIVSYLKLNLKMSHKLKSPDIFVKGFKKLKIDFWQIAMGQLVKPPLWYLFNPILIMCKKGWCVKLGQEE